MKIRFELIYSCILFFLLSSCGENSIYQNNREFKDGLWAANELVEFSFTVQDTSANYNLAYTLRNSLNYPYYNLYLKYRLKDSIGSTLTENLQELILMDKKTGKPYGSGFGEMYDHQFVSLRNYNFPSKGKYYFQIQHYMRLDSLPEIYSLGLKVVESD